MKGLDIIKYLEDWAPKGIAWEKDNPGLQIGSVEYEVKNVFLCLELTGEALNEAINKKCNLIITHHPLLFHPIKSLNFTKDKNSQIIEKIIKNDIVVYSAHTNLDFTKDGVSFQLAKALSLNNVRFIKNLDSNQFKLVVFVPENNLEHLTSALFDAGAGIIGEYKKCSFRVGGKGTFEGSANSNPAIGSALNYEEINEVRLETIVYSWKLKNVISALLKNHPYEEPAYDVYPLSNENVNYGMGAVGELKDEMSLNSFLRYVKERISSNFRYCNGKGDKIKKVAVCGGSGSELLPAAIASRADAFITADIKYHTFQDAEGRILLIDAGHFETEIFSLSAIKEKLDILLANNKSGIRVKIFKGTTNPVRFYKN
jgi:dinuclear metal center YbgI/SA1388 family protein